MQSSKSPSPYLTPPQIAVRLGVTNSKILGWIQSGELRAVNLAATRSNQPRWKVLESDLERFLESRTALPPEPKKMRRRNERLATGEIDFFSTFQFSEKPISNVVGNGK